MKPLQFDAVRVDLGEVVVRLLDEPGFGAAAEYYGEPYGHFGGDSALSVHEFGKCGSRDTEGGGCIGDGQAQRLDALAVDEAARMWWILHR